MKRADIMMVLPGMPLVIEGVEKAFTLHKLWQETDAQRKLAEIRHIVRGAAINSRTLIDEAFLSQFPNLEIISSLGVGYDHVDVEAARRHNVVVTHTPDVINEEVADTCLGLLLATLRKLPQADRHVRSGAWLKGPFSPTASLRDRTVGIFGLGRIGTAIARRLEAFDVEIAYHNRTERSGVRYRYFSTLRDLARHVDVLICVAPGGPETVHVVNTEILDALGPDGVLINVGRGTLVDERALIDALKEKRILSAGLDVYEDEPRVPQELIDMEHVVLLPHIGTASTVTRNAMGKLVVDNLIDWFSGRGPRTPIPETP